MNLSVLELPAQLKKCKVVAEMKNHTLGSVHLRTFALILQAHGILQVYYHMWLSVLK